MKKKKGKKAKKLTQEQEDILGLAKQVLRLEELVRDLRLAESNTASAVRSIEQRLRASGEALAGGALK